MKKNKNIFKTLLLIGLLGLTSCEHAEPSIEVPEFDPNDYQTEVDVEDAKHRIFETIKNSSKIDEMKVTSKVNKIEYGNNLLDMELENANAKVTSTAGSFKQVMNVTGLTATEPNDIMQSMVLQDIELNIKKEGIHPEESDDIQTVGCKANAYVKNNRQYATFDDPTLREYLPYILYGFGNFASIEDAKEEANKVPEKFYLPGEVFKKENLPLGGGFSNLKEEDMTKYFNYILDLNNQFETKFLTFSSKGNDLLMNIDLKTKHIIEILIKIMKEIQPNFDEQTEKTFRQFFSSFVIIEACEFYFMIDKNNNLSYQNIDIDFLVRSTVDVEVEPGVTHSHFKKDFSTIDMESYYDYKNVAINYPKDLNSYQEYDLQLPNLPELPVNIAN